MRGQILIMFFLIVVFFTALFFGFSSVSQSYASAKQAQAAIEASRTAQIASTGKPARSAAASAANSSSSRASETPMMLSCGTCPYRLGETSPPPLNTNPEHRPRAASSRSRAIPGVSTSGTAPAASSARR